MGIYLDWSDFKAGIDLQMRAQADVSADFAPERVRRGPLTLQPSQGDDVRMISPAGTPVAGRSGRRQARVSDVSMRSLHTDDDQEEDEDMVSRDGRRFESRGSGR